MKTKIILALCICCLLSCLVGMMINTSNAQSRSPMVSGWPFSVNFVEDPFRMHGLEIVSYSQLIDSGWTAIFTIPQDKKFIITDISTDLDATIHFKNDTTPSHQANLRLTFNNYNRLYSYQSGVVYGPNETVQGHIQSGSQCRVNISGYYVDL